MTHLKTVPAANALSRRSMLAALTLVPAVAAALPAVASSFQAGIMMSPLDKMVAEFQLLDAKDNEADSVSEAAFSTFLAAHPVPVVHHGRKAVNDPVTRMPKLNELGEVVDWTTWQFSYRDELENHFRQLPSWDWLTGRQKEAIAERRDALIAELDSLWSVWHQAKDVAGARIVSRAATIALLASVAACSSAETKDRFIVSIFSRRRHIEWGEISAIFGADAQS